MSNAILPSLIGLGFEVVRSAVWDTNVQQSISGKETRIARQTYPRWQWNLSYNVLRSNASYNELQQLAGFFNSRQGKFDTFLYKDTDDNNVIGQQIGVGDGVTTCFPLLRSFGGFIEPVLAPDLGASFAMYINGVRQTSGVATTVWGGGNSQGPGVVIFTAAPASGAIITADFSYYFPVRMSDDSVAFTLFLAGHYKAQKFGFISVKN